MVTLPYATTAELELIIVKSSRMAEAKIKGPLIFDKSIRDTLDDTDMGKVVVIDIDSGDYEIDYDDAAALFRLLERRPDAYTWSERVGFDAVHFIGFQPIPRGERDAVVTIALP